MWLIDRTVVRSAAEFGIESCEIVRRTGIPPTPTIVLTANAVGARRCIDPGKQRSAATGQFARDRSEKARRKNSNVCVREPRGPIRIYAPQLTVLDQCHIATWMKRRIFYQHHVRIKGSFQ